MRFLSFSILLLLAKSTLGLAAEEEPSGAKAKIKIERYVMATQVGVDEGGRCKAKKGPQIKEWRMPEFPAHIAHLETCVTVSSKKSRGLVDIVMEIQSPGGKMLLSVEGNLNLGSSGMASQTVSWDDLQVESPGVYQLVLKVDEQEVARFPMKVEKAVSEPSNQEKTK
jgi:hypothetical protein